MQAAAEVYREAALRRVDLVWLEGAELWMIAAAFGRGFHEQEPDTTSQTPMPLAQRREQHARMAEAGLRERMQTASPDEMRAAAQRANERLASRRGRR
jgi:hypothetical protein